MARTTASRTILSDGPHNQYSTIGGLPSLNAAISRLYGHRYGLPVDPATEVVSTSSGTEALYCALQALIDPGDKVLLFEPFFPWYLPDVTLAGGEPIVVALQEPDYSLDRAAVTAAFAQKPKLVLCNSPHNPTGRVFTRDELQFIADLCVQHGTLALSDEAYETVVFPGHSLVRLADLPGMRERTLAMGTASKLLSLTGWRVGWITGPAPLVAAVRTIHSYVTFCPPTPLQVGVAAAIQALVDSPDAQQESEDVTSLLAGNATLLGDALRAMAGVKVFQPQGGYFLVADVSGTGMDDFAFCRWLIEQRNINAVPMSVFYRPREGWICRTVRFAICKRRDTIERAVTALHS